jgi:hypothetical protein
MAKPAAIAGLMHTAAAPPRRAGRWQPALLLLALVLGLHAWLAGLLAPAALPPGPQRPGVVQLRSLPVPPLDQPAPLPEPTPKAAVVAALHRPPPEPAVQPAVPVNAAPPTAAALAAPGPAPDDTAQRPAADRPAGLADRTAVDAVAADDGPAGEPPPLYPTRLPPPTQQRYTLRLNSQVGEALLTWHHDGQHYRLTLDAHAGGAPLLSQSSSGGVDAHGLAPDRYVDSRRGGRAQAASFRRDIGRIGYSGPPQQHPAWPGAQDRLSWLAQLAAILAAADGPPPDALRLFVTDARGHAGLWQLQRQPDTTGPTPWGDAALQHWRRQPPRPEGLLVDVWLARDAGSPAGAWPVRLRMQVPRSGDVVDLQWLAAP